LKTRTQFNLKKDVAKDMFTDIQLMMEHDMNAELSIGYEVLERSDEDKRKITQYKLYEYSFLTGWAANALSVTEGIKNVKTTQGIIDIITKAYDMDYSDQRLKQIEELLKSLTDGRPSEDPDTADVEPIKDVFDQFETKLKLQNDTLWNLKN